MLMGNSTGFPVDYHQAGLIPGLDRGLGDQFLRQIIIKIRFFH